MVSLMSRHIPGRIPSDIPDIFCPSQTCRHPTVVLVKGGYQTKQMLLCPPLTAKLQPAQWTLLYSSKPWLAQYSCLMETAVSLFLKWFAQCEMGVLGTERCIADTTDRAKGFRDISCLLKGMARKRPTRFPLKCFSAGNQDMQPEFW